MKRFLIFAAASSLTLAGMAGCAAMQKPVLSQTVLDEKAGITLTRLYTTASRLGNKAARAGLIDQGKFKALDEKAYTAVLAARKAYDVGNATDYTAALADLTAALKGIDAL